MGLTKFYLLALSASMLIYFCAGANLRLKRSEDENDSNLDANGRCITARNWKSDCNSCWCEVDSVPACTLKGCIHLPLPTITTVEFVPTEEPTVDKKCTPGSKWKEDCNSCFCTEDGFSACTEVGCKTLETIIPSSE